MKNFQDGGCSNHLSKILRKIDFCGNHATALVVENNWTRLGLIDPIDPISKKSLKPIYQSDSKWSRLIESD